MQRLVVLFLLSWCFATAPALAAPKGEGAFLLLKLEGVIHGGTVEIVREAKEKAQAGYQGLIIALDTPGGLLEATREIVKIFLNSKLPIIVYVSPSGARAGSAGTFLTLAAHVAVMAPGTNMGAAHPITITGKDPEEGGNKHLAKKVENDTMAFIETIAKQRGRNVEWAKEAVKESSSITETKALELKVIDFIARDNRELLQKLDGRSVKTFSGELIFASKNSSIEEHHLPFALRFLNQLASPTTMFILLIIFVLGLYIEFSNPGMIFPAATSAVALLLLLFASRTLPISYLGLILIFLGMALLIAEVYVTSFGLLTVGGLVAFFIGSMTLFDPTKTDVTIPLSYVIAATLAVGCIAVVIGYLVMRSFKLPVVGGREGIVGMEGTIIDVLQPAGTLRVFVNSEYWNAESVADVSINKGDKVRVKAIEGLLLKVEPLR